MLPKLSYFFQQLSPPQNSSANQMLGITHPSLFIRFNNKESLPSLLSTSSASMYQLGFIKVYCLVGEFTDHSVSNKTKNKADVCSNFLLLSYQK